MVIQHMWPGKKLHQTWQTQSARGVTGKLSGGRGKVTFLDFSQRDFRLFPVEIQIQY